MMRADGVGPSKSMRRGAPGPAHAAPQPLPSRQQHDPRRAPALYPPAQEPAPFAHPQQGWGQGGARPGEWREPPHAGGWSAPPHGGSGAPPGGDYYQAVDALQRAEAELRSGRLPPHRHQQLVVVAEQLRREVDEWHRRGPPPARGAPPPVLGGADPRGYFGPGPAASMMPPPRAPGPDPRLASQAPPPGKDGRRLSANSIFQKLLNSGESAFFRPRACSLHLLTLVAPPRQVLSTPAPLPEGRVLRRRPTQHRAIPLRCRPSPSPSRS